MSTTSTKPVKVKKDGSRGKRKLGDTITESPSISETTTTSTIEPHEANAEEDLGTIEGSSHTRPSKKRKSSPAPELEVDISLPEPPSKRALRLLKKGKPLPPSKSGAESSPEPTSNEAKSKPVTGDDELKQEKRSEHGIWIGNLAFTVTTDDLKTFFTSNSDIKEAAITRIHMPAPNEAPKSDRRPVKKQYNKGFAYVDFSSAEDVVAAIALSESLLHGRRVLIKDAKSFDGRPAKPAPGEHIGHYPPGKEPSKRIFVGNLRFDTTEDGLRTHFEQCGPVEHIMIATFEDSGKCKGYGWVTFEELDAAMAAVKGWVMVEESDYEGSEADDDDDDTDDDDNHSGQAGNEDDDDAATADVQAQPSRKRRPTKTKTRRFVDKIFGRPLRREFAEAPQLRYKKRYGKDGTKNRAGAEDATDATAAVTGEEIRAGRGAVAGEAGKNKRTTTSATSTATGAIPRVKTVEYDRPYAARLTGGIVQSEGKKVVF